jgi:hypothetical protein
MLEVEFIWLDKKKCIGGDNRDEKTKRSARENEIDVKEKVDK